MNRARFRCAWMIASMVFLMSWGNASGAAEAGAGKSDDKADSKADEPKEQVVLTKHVATIGGKKIRYTATAGTLTLKAEDKGKVTPKASVFYVAYARTDDKASTATRPVTFAFNGGPGSSSVWLHLGLLGPRRVALDAEGNPGPPPYHLIDNDASLLDKTDLVFIDPVSTGYSRPAPGEDPKQFHGVQEDVQSVGEFIRAWTARNGRWGSPKFLAGESYGTTRAAGLAGHLQEDLGMYLNGVVLVSAVLDFQTIVQAPDNDLSYVLYLPTFATTAWNHKRLGADLERLTVDEVMRRAESFAMHDYALALMQGDALPDVDRDRIAAEMSALTGLSRDFILRNRLRVPLDRFMKELLRDQGRIVGRYDSRVLGIDRDSGGEGPDYDPSYASLQGAFTATLNEYLRAELNYKSDLPYEILTGHVQPWNWGRDSQNQFLDVSETLRRAISYNPALRIFVASGRYDLATPTLAAIYTVNHLALDKSLRGNVTMGFYDAGHMMYSHRPSREKLRADLGAFLDAATAR
jgi:carboxypeptidase C (cathepsin A)